MGATVANNTITSEVEAYLSGSTDVVTTNLGSLKLEANQLSSITAYSVAASIAVSTEADGFALSGGGASATNEIYGKTNAYLLNSAVTSGRDVSLTATNTSTIEATVVGLALAGSGGPAALGIGVALATNSIGGTTTPFEVRAYVQDSSIIATSGHLTQTATSHSTVTSTVVAGSVAVTAKSTGIALGGAGASGINTVTMWVQAAIDGDSVAGIRTGNITLTADDTSKITSVTVGATIAASLLGDAAAAMAIGVSLSENVINNKVEASIKNADGVVSTGAITLAATDHSAIHAVSVAAAVAAAHSKDAGFAVSGAGAESTNRISTKTNALVKNSVLVATGNVSITSESRSAADSED